jgi:tryptophan halogenase
MAHRFVIVGGGTAGWLAALMLQDAARRAGLPAGFTVIESSRIPTIGVGEGTTAVFRMMLKYFGFDEFEFLRETEATIKLGIRHRDWRRRGHSYDGPIDDPHQVSARPKGAGSYLDAYAVGAGRPVADHHLFGQLLKRDKSPFGRGKGGQILPMGPFHHAYHFDQALAGQYLRRKSAGVQIVDAQVEGAEKDGAGRITALCLEGGGRLAGDFFIDCTGFRRRLIGAEMGAKWVSYADILPVNRAMPFWLDHPKDGEVTPATLAWAQGAGWMWSIPTQSRIGCGYVYSDRHISPDQAQAEIEGVLGHPIQPRNDIRIDAGRLDRPWIGNCLALGLASSFLEPLEATSIHGTIVQLMTFCQFHLKAPDRMTVQDRADYNAAIARQVDDFRDFINLHYVSERDDTPFWRDVKAAYIGPNTRARVAHWARSMPADRDFRPFPGRFPHVETTLHYPVLDGLGLLHRDTAKAALAERPQIRALGRKSVESLEKEYRLAAGRALGHREFLELVAGGMT